jgi:molybdopterin converting factor small subunit
MARLKVKIYEACGTDAKKEVDICMEEEKPTLSSVLQKLSNLFGQRILDYMIAVNGREMRRPEELERKVSETDVIAVFMPVSGG